MKVKNICMNCMSEQLNENGVCMACGMKESAITTTKKHLPLRTVLKGKYLVGRVTGEGGFGITYVGYDLDLEIKVAIKEFCPGNIAGREATDSVTIMPFGSREKEVYESEKEKFINEAKRLAKFRKLEGVVSVLDYFRENNTAYIVMDYIEGVTLKQYCKMLNVPMRWDELLGLVRPVLKSLSEIHAAGIIHRDISADNIMISKDKKSAYLIDFGTARAWEEGTLSAYEKDFYTPWEQTSKTIEQGPWTDVYALCATIYYCMTNHRLPLVSDRHGNEQIVLPSQLGIQVPAYVEAALEEGLALHPNNRIRSMEELEQKLYSNKQVVKKDVQPVASKAESNVEAKSVSVQDAEEEEDGFKVLETLKASGQKGKVLSRINDIAVVGSVVCLFIVAVIVGAAGFGLAELIISWIVIMAITGTCVCLETLEIKRQSAILGCLFDEKNCDKISYIQAQIKWLKSVRMRNRGFGLKQIVTDYSSAGVGQTNKLVFYKLYKKIETYSNIPEDLKKEWLIGVEYMFSLQDDYGNSGFNENHPVLRSQKIKNKYVQNQLFNLDVQNKIDCPEIYALAQCRYMDNLYKVQHIGDTLVCHTDIWQGGIILMQNFFDDYYKYIVAPSSKVTDETKQKWKFSLEAMLNRAK